MTDEHTHDTMAPGWHVRASGKAGELRSLYRRLDELTEGQRDLLDASRTEELLSLLTARRGLIDRIQQLANELLPVLDGWDRLGADVPEPQRTELDESIREIKALNAGILARDEAHTAELVTQRDSLARELSSIDRGRAAVSAYSGSSARHAAPRFQDRKG
ncbi:MAG: hypothetical protein ACF8Q5_09015 [Phycisphaerales bacterium JB040]